MGDLAAVSGVLIALIAARVVLILLGILLLASGGGGRGQSARERRRTTHFSGLAGRDPKAITTGTEQVDGGRGQQVEGDRALHVLASPQEIGDAPPPPYHEMEGLPHASEVK
jgi:hypothetical protein